MINPSFFQLLNEFKLIRIKFFLELKQDTYLPEYSGSTLHGLLGRALKKYDENAYQSCFIQQNKVNQPKPYAIIANKQNNLQIELNHKSLKIAQWKQGDIYTFEIKLFAQATQLAERIVNAIMHFGKTDGIGVSRSKYDLISYCSVCGDQYIDDLKSESLIDHINPKLLDSSNFLISSPNIKLHLNTPLRLQNRGNSENSSIMQQSPDLQKILSQIANRWESLSIYWNNSSKDFLKLLYQNLPKLEQTENCSTTYFKKLERYSADQKIKIPYGGLLGHLHYKVLDNKADILPWLAVGQQLQIGGKTTFGLGDYSLIC